MVRATRYLARVRTDKGFDANIISVSSVIEREEAILTVFDKLVKKLKDKEFKDGWGKARKNGLVDGMVNAFIQLNPSVNCQCWEVEDYGTPAGVIAKSGDEDALGHSENSEGSAAE